MVSICFRKEIKQIHYTSMLRAITMSLLIFLNRVAIYLNILLYVLLGNTPNHEYVYVMIGYYQMFRMAVTVFLPQAMTCLAETNVSVKRIEKFLMYEEKSLPEIEYNIKLGNTEKEPHQSKSSPLEIKIEHGSVKWIQSLPDNSLEKINFHASPNELVAIVGPVGSGKTTLLHTILKELPLNEGSINVSGTISYASQEPWLFGGSVRQNILFGQKFDENKYEEVVRVCALERDFKLFPYGDKTLVGDRGVSLSGGQRARINLARTVYKEADIYLLDDPLSAVDTHVGRQLFDNCICSYLKSKIVVLVTHQLQYLTNVENIYLLDNGKVKASGSYHYLKDLDNEFSEMLKKSIMTRVRRIKKNRNVKVW